MKNLKIFILFTLAIVTSCSKDDDSSDASNSSEAKLVGSWVWSKSETDGEEYTLDECDQIGTIVFAENGTGLETYYYNNGTECINDGTDAFAWSLSGDTLSVTYAEDGDEFTYTSTVLELNDTTFVVQYIDEYEENGETVESIYVETYTKVQ